MAGKCKGNGCTQDSSLRSRMTSPMIILSRSCYPQSCMLIRFFAALKNDMSNDYPLAILFILSVTKDLY